jgi:NAD(P)-dependent dehydrogenase (short-subunit alcohol dehydrogenase family)
VYYIEHAYEKENKFESRGNPFRMTILRGGNSSMAFTDRVAVITGGTSGIGEATARLFVAEGAHVVIAGRSEKRGAAVAEALGERAEFCRTDVREEAEIRELIDFATSRFGRIDCLFNNAGEMGTGGGIAELTADDFDEAIEILLRSVFLGMKYAAPVMCEAGTGSIINCASIAAHRTGRGTTLYSMAKAGVLHLTRCVAMELGERGVRVNSISPGFIATPMMAGARQSEAPVPAGAMAGVERHLATLTPMQRHGAADDIARAALFLASDGAAFINGQDLVVDGGTTQGELWRDQAGRLTEHT